MADEYGNYGNQDVEAWRRIPKAGESMMEAEPPLWKRITTSIMHDPLPVPSVGGLVMKGPTAAANAAKIASMIPEGLSPAEHAIAYLKAKYPLYSKMVNSLTANKFLPDTLGGQYSHNDAGLGEAMINGNRSQIVHGVESGAHELTHGMQDVRSQRVPIDQFPSSGYPKPTLSGPGVGRTDAELGPYGREVTPHGTVRPSEYDIQTSARGYYANPYESQARDAGDTARSTYNKYKDLTDPPTQNEIENQQYYEPSRGILDKFLGFGGR